MGRITKLSQIEVFRVQRHGRDSELRFLTDDTDDPSGYVELGRLFSHFYITKGGVDANTGEYRAKLAFNRPVDFSVSALQRTVFIDLVLDGGTRILRYRRSSENPPTTVEDRWYFVLTGAFNDKTPVSGLFIFPPDDGGGNDPVTLASVLADIQALFNNQGDLSNLTTFNKSNLVAAINEVKSLIGTGGGGGAGSDLIVKIAGESLGGHRIVKSINQAAVGYADNLTPADRDLILGVTTSSAAASSAVDVRTFGEMVEPSWSWTSGGLIFCGTNGLLTQTPPSSGFLCVIGAATSATSIFIRVGQPISLI